MVNVYCQYRRQFPYRTFYTLSDRYSLSAEVRLLLTAGLCGGFTTFSTFSIDILGMIRQGYTALALIYVAASIILGLGACFRERGAVVGAYVVKIH